MTTSQIWQIIAAGVGAYAALLGGLYAVVTRPLLKRLDAIERRLDRIETLFLTHEERITRGSRPAIR